MAESDRVDGSPFGIAGYPPLFGVNNAQKAALNTAIRWYGEANTKVSDGSTASYYVLPSGAAELQDLIAYRNMNAQMGEIFRACYRYGQVAHSPRERDLKKIIFYAQAELDRLEKYGDRDGE